jgi:choline dehydrogenase
VPRRLPVIIVSCSGGARMMAVRSATPPRFARFVKWEVMPGAGRNQLERFIRNPASSYWHDTCFGQMGRDSMSVVDGQLRVQRHRHAAYCRWRRHAARDDREHARHPAASSRERAAEILPAAHELRRHEP